MTDDLDVNTVPDVASQTDHDALAERVAELETAVTGLLAGFEAVARLTEERLAALEDKR